MASSAPQTDLAQMEAILASETVGHLAMAADDEPYIVPINYAYVEGRILLHCSLRGKKLDMIRANPKVCFEVSRQEGPPVEHAGEACDDGFESVICWGTARSVGDVTQRHRALSEFQARYATPDKPGGTLTIERAAKCGVIEIAVTRMTGRRHMRGRNACWEWERD